MSTPLQIYRTTFPPPPTEENYTPPPFNGPLRRIEALHNFPRGGFTNDFAAIASFQMGRDDGDKVGGGDSGGGMLGSLFNNTLLTELEYVPSSQLSNLTYEQDDAKDYIRGIATASILILMVYILWGVSLFVLRVGRMDSCFRVCRRRKSTKNQQRRDSSVVVEGGSEVENSSTRAMVEYDNDEEEEEEEGQDCCCITCRESIRAKGGCCTRNIFCGWMAGKTPTVPTRSSLMKEKELRERKLIRSGVKSLNESVKSAAGRLKSGTGGEVVAEADVAVAAVDDEAQDKSTDSTDITDEYLAKRQNASRRTMLGIRITFLLSALLVIIFSIKLCFDGFRGINSIVASTDQGINAIAEHIDAVKTEVDDYIAINEEMALRKEEWLERTSAQIQDGFDGKPWCPIASNGDGTIEVNVSLAKLLLKGNLFKLALIDKRDEFKDQVANGVAERRIQVEGGESVVDGAIDVVKEQVFTVVTFLDDLRDAEGGRIQGVLDKVLSLKDAVGEVGSADGTRIKMLVAKLTTLVRSLIEDTRVNDWLEAVFSDGAGGRALQLQPTDAIIETVVEKDGIKYTILSLADNFTGTDLIINGYNMTRLFTTNLTVEIDVATLTESINEKLDDTSSVLLDIFKRLQSALDTLYQQTRNAQDSLDSIVPYFNVAVIFAAVLIGLTSFFIIGTILAWTNKQPRLYRCAQDGIILPIFILVGLLVWVFTVVFLSLAVLTGDYCVVSPDIQMSEIFQLTLGELSPIGFKFAFYYFNGCESQLRPILMDVAYKALISSRVGLDQFFELVGNLGEGPLRQACGLGNESDIAEGDPVNALSVLANVIRNHIGGAMSTAITVGNLTLCKTFYPIYSFLAHEIVCTDFINLFGPLFSSLFVISIFSMIMVTMRVAWHELVEDEVTGADRAKSQEDLGADEVAEMDEGEAVNDEVAEEEKDEPAGDQED